MSDHVHEWDYVGEIEYEYICKGCTEQIHFSEVIRRLDATEKLSAEDAREIAIEIHGAWWPLEGESPYEDGLRAYASALEGNEKP